MLEITVNSIKLEWEQSIFPGGEVFVKITNIEAIRGFLNPLIVIDGSIRNSNQFFEVALLIDAIYQECVGHPRISWYMGYFPYARQDRVCAEGESLSVGVFASILFSLPFLRRVHISDIHSKAAEGLITIAADNAAVAVTFFKQVQGFKRDLYKEIEDNLVLLAPDAGAKAKTENLRDVMYPTCKVVQASKVRKDGRISVTIDKPELLAGKDVLIVDDICDGGGTFLALAKEVEHLVGTKSINLYVTHGIFSKGRKILLNEFDTVNATYDWTKGE